MSIDDDRQISRFVSDRLPEFVRIDHPTLVAFLEAYYEWLDLRRDSGLVVSPMAMHDIPDVDTSLEQFIDNFKSQFLFNFPDSLAINKDTNEPVDVRRLIKNIKQFYLAKGTEKSYEFLFRIFYDTNVEFYYPKKDILKLSSGRWTQNNYLRISNSLGDQIYRAAGNLLIQKNDDGEIVATARVVSVNVYQVDNFDVAELLISNRNGTFQAGELGVEFTDGDQTFKEVRVYSVVSTVNITNGGSNYQLGERVNFVAAAGDYGQRGRGTVSEVDAVGGIRKINIDDFGINYGVAPTIEIETGAGVGFSGTAVIGALCQSFGYYVNNDGRLSTNKVLQDNHYYQNWSYVLKAEVVIDTYRELIRRLVHPVGTGMFGSVLIKRCSRANLDNASSLMSFRIPYIGNYTPYTFQTFDDLSLWFQESITGGMTASGYLPSAHDGLIQGVGNRTAIIGNPISNSVDFKEVESGWLSTAGFPNADPFWIVYPHPNKQVERGYHYARVWKSQVEDFVSWSEWINNHQPRLTEKNRFDEMRLQSFDGGIISQASTLNQGGIAGDPAQGSGVEDPYGRGDCFPPDANGNDTAPCQVPLQLETPNPCCCCVDDPSDNGGGPLPPNVLKCNCLNGAWRIVGGGWQCSCPHGYLRRELGCGFECYCPEGSTECNPDCNPPLCPPPPICNGNCPYTCCPDGDCPDPVFGCNRSCLDPVYAAANCCECYGEGGGPPGGEVCCSGVVCDPLDPESNCCDDPCTEECWSFCLNFPNHPRCTNRCSFHPCCTGCTPECNPDCLLFDPCLTTCPGFDYCITGSTGWSSIANATRLSQCPEYGPCYDGPRPPGYPPCFDKCTAAGCSGYTACHPDCNPDYCDTESECYNECRCDDPCAACPDVDWCACDPDGATCCAAFPCRPECNPDLCDPMFAGGQCYNPCDPSCTPDACNPANKDFGCYRPCDPECNPNNCNPLCPGYDRCNRACPNYDTEYCCQGCNCGNGGQIGDPVYRDLDDAIRRWNVDNPRFNPEDNNPCNNDNANCLFGQNNFDPNAHLGTLLKYDENSEFRKITMRAFFNMPAGQAFDCREETLTSVALPQFVIATPKDGDQIKEAESPNRPLDVLYTIQNAENIGYYKIKQANIYIDNRLKTTVAINALRVTLLNIQDGRRTLKMEMIDEDGNFVAGTQKIVIFGYEYAFRQSMTLSANSTDDQFDALDFLQSDDPVYDVALQDAFDRANSGNDEGGIAEALPDDISGSGTTPDERSRNARNAWLGFVCTSMQLQRDSEFMILFAGVYGCLYQMCEKPTPCSPPTPFAFACRWSLCDDLRGIYRCLSGSETSWSFDCSDPLPFHLGGLTPILPGYLPLNLPSEVFGTGGVNLGPIYGAYAGQARLVSFMKYDACRLEQCLESIYEKFKTKACQPLETDCVDDQGNFRYNCIQDLTLKGKNPFCSDPDGGEEFNRNMFKTRYVCPLWRYEYPGWHNERYLVDGQWIYTGRGWYGGPNDRPPEGSDDPENIERMFENLDRLKRDNPLTKEKFEEIWRTTPCGSCWDDGNDCKSLIKPGELAVREYNRCIGQLLVDSMRRTGKSYDSTIPDSEYTTLRRQIRECCNSLCRNLNSTGEMSREQFVACSDNCRRVDGELFPSEIREFLTYQRMFKRLTT